MVAFRIAHISDFHFSTRPKRKHWIELFRQTPWRSFGDLREGNFDNFPTGHSEEIAELAARFLYAQRRRIDLIAITGDLATTGRLEFLRAAHSFTNSIPQRKYINDRGEPTLKGSSDCMLLMPGNHDRYRDNKGNAGSNNFEFVYEGPEDWPAGQGQVLHRVIENDTGRLAIVAADFCLRQNSDAGHIVRINRWGRGKAYADTIARLISRTTDIRNRFSPVGVVWAVHFPPSEDTPSHYRLNDAHLLIEAAEKSGINLLLAGHLHESLVRKVGKDIHVLCAGSLSSLGDRYWIHFLELEVAGDSVAHCIRADYAWDDDAQDYSVLSSQKIL